MPLPRQLFLHSRNGELWKCTLEMFLSKLAHIASYPIVSTTPGTAVTVDNLANDNLSNEESTMIASLLIVNLRR